MGATQGRVINAPPLHKVSFASYSTFMTTTRNLPAGTSTSSSPALRVSRFVRLLTRIGLLTSQ